VDATTKRRVRTFQIEPRSQQPHPEQVLLMSGTRINEPIDRGIRDSTSLVRHRSGIVSGFLVRVLAQCYLGESGFDVGKVYIDVLQVLVEERQDEVSL